MHKASDDPTKNSAPNAVDRASSKTPLDSDEHIDPRGAREAVEQERQAKRATSKSEGGSAPIEAKPNHVRERDDRETNAMPEEMRSLSAHEQSQNKLRNAS